MPELPEVEVVRLALDSRLPGLVLRQVSHSGARLRYPLPDFSPLAGQQALSVRRRAKYLLTDFSHGQTLLWHLGMTGQFHMLQPATAPARHEHVRLDFEEGLSLRYRDARRFGYAGICQTKRCDEHPWLRSLGPEPLSLDFPLERWCDQLRRRTTSIKQCLMDNRLIVGVGNIYASESLFRAGIHPRRPAQRIAKTRLYRLHAVIREVLQEAIAAGGSTIQDFSRPDGRPGYFAHRFAVYGRAGQPCYQCRQPIHQCTQAGRSTFYCARCQH